MRSSQAMKVARALGLMTPRYRAQIEGDGSIAMRPRNV